MAMFNSYVSHYQRVYQDTLLGGMADGPPDELDAVKNLARKPSK
jgi:hypothetical protein